MMLNPWKRKCEEYCNKKQDLNCHKGKIDTVVPYKMCDACNCFAQATLN